MHIVAGLEIARRADQIGEALQLFPREALYEVSLHRRSISAPEQGRVFNPKPQLAILVVAPLQHSGKKHMPVAKELSFSFDCAPNFFLQTGSGKWLHLQTLYL